MIGLGGPHQVTNDVVLEATSNVLVGLVFCAQPGLVAAAKSNPHKAERSPANKLLFWLVFILWFYLGLVVGNDLRFGTPGKRRASHRVLRL